MSVERGTQLTGEAYLKWISTYTLLEAKGLMREEHEDLLLIYCDAYAMWKEAVERIAATTFLTKSPRDGVVVSPWVTIKQEALATMDKIGRQLGLSPDHPIAAPGVTYAQLLESAYPKPEDADKISPGTNVDDDLDDEAA